MKLLIHANRIIGSAGDEYTGPDACIAAPPDYDPQKDYVLVDGVPTAEPPATDPVPRYDVAQMLTALQQQRVCENIGVGNPDHSFVADYILAKS